MCDIITIQYKMGRNGKWGDEMVEASKKENSFKIVEGVKEKSDRETIYENLCNFNSKYKDDILKCIYVKERVSNKQLAEYLSVTPSGLNPVITRFLDLKPSVIREESLGRQKFYQLTETAKRVIDDYSLLETVKYEEKKNGNELIELLKKVQELLGEKWELAVDDYYTSGKQLDIKSQEFLEEFENELKYVVLNDGREKVTEVEKYINNAILVARVEKRIEQFEQRYKELNKICVLDAGDGVDAFVFIDDFCKYVLVEQQSEKFANEHEKYGIDNLNEMKMILERIESMYQESQTMKKDEIFKTWKEDFPEKNQKLIYYIAEKFSGCRR